MWIPGIFLALSFIVYAVYYYMIPELPPIFFASKYVCKNCHRCVGKSSTTPSMHKEFKKINGQ